MGLKIIVCIKSIVLDAPDGRITRAAESSALNPFDRPAIEMALRLREEHGGTVTALSMGPEAAAPGLYEAKAMGADKSVLISDRALSGSDTLATSSALGAATKKLAPYDLVLFGTRTSDSDTGQVGPQTAVYLDIPVVTGACGVEYEDSALIVERKIDEFIETYNIFLPGALTIHPTAVQPRDATLTGIESSFQGQPFEVLTLADIGIAAEEVGEAGSPTKVVSMSRMKKTRKCEFIKGSIEEQAEELIKQLQDAGQIG